MFASGRDTAHPVPLLAEAVNQNPSLSFIIQPQINSLMISHTFLTLLIPLVLSLFHFSTPESRRRPIFFLNAVAIFLAFVVSLLIDISSIHKILEPLNPLPLNLSITIGFLGVWQSIFVDLILLVRLISIYPPQRIGLIRFPLLIAIPVLLKLARVVNVILFTIIEAKAADGPSAAIITLIVFTTKPYLKIEWATQMIDNTYASLVFLWAIRDGRNKQIVSTTSNVTFSQRLHTLSRIALTNFVVPTAFSIIQFISVYRGASADVLEQLVLVNMMLATFGIAFATVWAGNFNRREAQRYTATHVMPVFANPKGSSYPGNWEHEMSDT